MHHIILFEEPVSVWCWQMTSVNQCFCISFTHLSLLLFINLAGHCRPSHFTYPAFTSVLLPPASLHCLVHLSSLSQPPQCIFCTSPIPADICQTVFAPLLPSCLWSLVSTWACPPACTYFNVHTGNTSYKEKTQRVRGASKVKGAVLGSFKCILICAVVGGEGGSRWREKAVKGVDWGNNMTELVD